MTLRKYLKESLYDIEYLAKVWIRYPEELGTPVIQDLFIPKGIFGTAIYAHTTKESVNMMGKSSIWGNGIVEANIEVRRFIDLTQKEGSYDYLRQNWKTLILEWAGAIITSEEEGDMTIIWDPASVELLEKPSLNLDFSNLHNTLRSLKTLAKSDLSKYEQTHLLKDLRPFRPDHMWLMELISLSNTPWVLEKLTQMGLIKWFNFRSHDIVKLMQSPVADWIMQFCKLEYYHLEPHQIGFILKKTRYPVLFRKYSRLKI